MKIKAKLLFAFVFGLAGQIQAQTNIDIEKGHSAYDSKFYSVAVESYERGLANGSPDLKAQLRLATCYQFMNDYDKAEALYARAAKNPEMEAHPAGCYSYAMVLKVNGKHAEAEKWIKKIEKKQAYIASKARASLEFSKSMKDKSSAYKVRAEKKVNTAEAEYAPTLFRNKVAYTSSKIIQLPVQGGQSTLQDNYYFVTEPSASGQLDKGASFQKNDQMGRDRNLAPLSFGLNGTKAASTFNSFQPKIRHLSRAGMNDLEIIMYDVEANGQLKVSSSKAFPYNTSEKSTGFPALSANGNTLVFAQNTGKVGDYDLFISRKKNGVWGKPVSLGTEINTMGDEIAPFISANNTLYFSSDFHKGLGGYDIYKADYNPQKGTWENVRHLGNSVNTPYDDVYFVYDDVNNRGYFSSNRKGGAGDYDIYSCEMVGTEDQMPRVTAGNNDLADNGNNNGGNNNGGNNNGNANNDGNGNNNGTNNGGNNNGNGNYGGTDYNNDNNNGGNNNGNGNNDGGNNYGYNNGDNTNGYNHNNGGNNNGNGNYGNNNNGNANNNGNGNNNGDGDIPCGIDFYTGSVVDAVTKKPVEDVTIFVLPDATNTKAKVSSSPFGEYYVKLQRNTAYTIWFSKAGYKNRSFQINPGNGDQRLILGARSIVPIGVNIPDDRLDNDPDFVQNQTDDSNPNPNNTNDRLGNDLNIAYEYSYPPKGKPLPENGYLVQVGKFKKLSPENRQKLLPYGHIFQDKKSDGTVYKVGIFADETHAKTAAKALSKKGFTGAYPVRTDIRNASAVDRMRNQNQIIYPKGQGVDPNANNSWADNDNFIKRSTGGDGNGPITEEKVHNDYADNDGLRNNTADNSNGNNFQEFDNDNQKPIEFKIQLGAFSKPENVSFPALSSLGSIQKQKRSNGLTYFYLASYSTIDSAKRARQLAQEKGVKSPFIVGFRNGKRVNLDELLK